MDLKKGHLISCHDKSCDVFNSSIDKKKGFPSKIFRIGQSSLNFLLVAFPFMITVIWPLVLCLLLKREAMYMTRTAGPDWAVIGWPWSCDLRTYSHCTKTIRKQVANRI